MKYRVDYVTRCGKRGVWHYEIEAYDLQEAQRMCLRDMKQAEDHLRRNHDLQLRKLVLVQVVEHDVADVIAANSRRK